MLLVDDSAFILGMTTLILGSIAMCVTNCLKSKCDMVDCGCCGFKLNIHRNVLVEEDIELGLGKTKVEEEKVCEI